MSDSTSYTVALITGVLSAAFLMLHMLAFSKLAEAGIISDTAIAELSFTFELLGLVVFGVLLYGVAGIIAEVLRLYEAEITALSWQVRGGAYAAVVVAVAGSLGATYTANQPAAADAGTFIRMSILVVLLASAPFASLLLTQEDLEHVVGKVRGVMA